MKRFALLVAVLLLAGLIGCSDDSSTNPDDAQTDFQLSVSQLTFVDGQADAFFTIQSVSGDTLAWSITEFESWLAVSPAQGSASAVPDTVYVTVDREGLTPGEYDSTIKVVSENGSDQSIAVQLQVPIAPILFVDPQAIDIAENYNGALLTIQNTGGDSLHWFLTNHQPWLITSAFMGTSTGEIDTVVVGIDRGVMHSGLYADTVFVNTSDGQKDTIRVTMEVPQELASRIVYWTNRVVEENHYLYSDANSNPRDCRPVAHLELTDWPEDYGLEIFLMNSTNFDRYLNEESFDVYWHQSVYYEGTYNFSGSTVIPYGTIVYVVVDNTNLGWDETDFDFSNDKAYFNLSVDLQPE
ncbi:hypothetical protein KQI52_14935 [bacterium]|nr:hypothetical protein [bacterium]